jgi:phenylalanyl-tRNA synthetase beta chain
VVQLLEQLAGASAGKLGATFVDLTKQPEILLPKGFASWLVGVDYSEDEITKVLLEIGAVTTKDASGLKVTPPSWRPDLLHKTDLVEEIARILGYDRIPSRLPIAPPGRGLSRAQQFRSGALDALATAGFVEVLSYPFVSAENNGWFADPKHAVSLANPIQEESGQLRLSLIPGLIETAKRNLSRGFTDLALVEQGSIFRSVKQAKISFPDTTSRPSNAEISSLNDSIPNQPKHLAGIFMGNRVEAQPGLKPVRFGVQDALYAAKLVGQAIGVSFELKQAEPTGYHPGRSAELIVGNKVVGFVGEIAPAITKLADLPRTVGVFEIDLDALLDAAPESVVAKPIGTLPAATQDLSLVVSVDVPAAELMKTVREGCGELLEEISLTDDYRGSNIASGSKSLTFALRFRAMDRTLTQVEASEARDRAVALASKRFKAEIRA